MLIIILFSFSYKFAAALLGSGFLLVFIGYRSKKDLWKHVCYNAAAVGLALCLFETYLTCLEVRTDHELTCEEEVHSESGNLAIFDKDLGYKPAAEGEFHAVKRDIVMDKDVFNVHYTLRNHQRVTPSSNPSGSPAVWFVGCSNTFGFGLDDSTTLPNQFGTTTGSRYRIENLGFNGYGCHQIYQQALDLPAAKGDDVVIYSFLMGHISRAAGYSSWDRDGPRFELLNNEPVDQGPFDQPTNKLLKILDGMLLKSRIYKRFFKQFFRPITGHDIDRAAGLIIATHRELQAKGYRMHLFIHDISEHIFDEFKTRDKFEKFINHLRADQINISFLTDAIADYNEALEQYTHGDCDRHPNAVANKWIADHLVEQLNVEPALAIRN